MLKNRTALPRLDYLLTFEVAAELESFAAAARELNVSETAISRKIRLLEEHFNCALFVRGHRSVQLTDQGRKLLAGITAPLQMLEQTAQSLHSAPRPGTVRLAATNSVAALWLLPRLPRFQKSHPDITISLFSSDLDKECLSEPFDLTILRGEGRWPGYRAVRLFGETVFPVCSPEYAGNHSSLARADELPAHALIDVRNNHTEWLNWTTWLAQKGVDPARIRHVTQVNTYPLAIQAAVDGLGIALGWGHLVDRHLQEGRLVRPLGEIHVRTNSGYYLLRHENARRDPDAEQVVAWLLRESAARQRYAAW